MATVKDFKEEEGRPTKARNSQRRVTTVTLQKGASRGTGSIFTLHLATGEIDRHSRSSQRYNAYTMTEVAVFFIPSKK